MLVECYWCWLRVTGVDVDCARSINVINQSNQSIGNTIEPCASGLTRLVSSFIKSAEMNC